MVETRRGTDTTGTEENRPAEENQPPAERMERMDLDGGNADQEGESSGTSRDDEMQETLDERFESVERVKAELGAKRKIEALTEMERELAGGPPAEHIDFEGLAYRPKRPASSDPPGAQPQVAPFLRPAKPPYFRGKSLKEAQEYENGWLIHIAAIPPKTPKELIAYAATYLLDTARDSWNPKNTTIQTWEEYMEWCRNVVKDPVNRMHYALMRIKKLEAKAKSERTGGRTRHRRAREILAPDDQG
ncbi:hypothetical protein GJ744_004957 [Endocarpon pusillum]|uniref:Uncharacterized protein n=1 Tax=Endocarpon pusillum TaxID=364733 RepID=A0A8H7DZV9_9EURO|nr:hypothetical protein GJ744_004957 [Endocarpon pusillum]